jgi:hypothetical protein
MRISGIHLLTVAMLIPLAAFGGEFGKQNYMLRCAGCHLTDGSGNAASGIPDLRGSIGKFLHTSEGRAFLVQVPGTANSPLSDQEVTEVLAWMLDNFSKKEMPPGATPYTADEVHRLRASTPADIPKAREQVVQGLRDAGQQVR